MDAFTLVAKLTLDSDSFNAKLKEVEGTMNSEETTGAFSKWGVTVGNLAADAIKSTVGAAIDFVKSSIETGMNFDYQMGKVYAIMKGGGDLSQEQMDRLRETALEMGRTTTFTAEQAAEALAYMAQAGWNTDQAIEGLPGLLQLAASSGTDLGETASIVTNALNAFGLKATDAGHFADLLAVAASSADTNVALMGETFKYVAANAGTMNISAEDIAHSIGLIANSGIKGSQAGTALSRILTRIATDAGASKETLGALGVITQELGVDVYTAEGKFRDWGDILAETREKWQGLTDDQQKMNFANQIAGQYGLAAWNALMNASVEDVNELQSQIDNAEGRAALMSDTMLDNLKGDLTLMNSAIDGLKILVSDEYTGKLRGFVSTFTEEIGKMGDAFEEGGLAGMFTNLTDWIIDGITTSLKDPNITRFGAEGFGEALGEFVGHLISKLVSSAPTVMSGLFTAGVNLAGGIVQGLFAGLFGTGDDSMTKYIEMLAEQEDEAVQDAMDTSIKAQGIVKYMDDLVAKYGDAATDTKEWADAMDRLKGLLPDVTTVIGDQSQSVSDMTGNLKEFINLTRNNAIEAARNKTLNDLRQKYMDTEVELGVAQQGIIDAQNTKTAAGDAIIDLLKSRYGDLFTADSEAAYRGMMERGEFGKIKNELYAAADQLELPKGFVDGLITSYEDSAKAATENAGKVEELSSAADSLSAQLRVAEAAAAHAAQVLGSMSGLGAADGTHAIGSPYIPYDNYHAILHRGETVLTATQARMLRAGGGGSASSAEIAAAVRSAVLDLTMELNGQTVGRVFGDATTRRVSNNMSQMTRRHQYGYGG